jgi:hypothetical protein
MLGHPRSHITTAAAHAGSPTAPAPETPGAKHTHAEAIRSGFTSEGRRQRGGSVPAILSWAAINSSAVSGHRFELPTSTSPAKAADKVKSSGRPGQHVRTE